MKLEKTESILSVSLSPVEGLWAVYKDNDEYFKVKIYFVLAQLVEDKEHPDNPTVNFKYITTADLMEKYIFLNEPEEENFIGLLDENKAITVADISQIQFFDRQ